MKSAVVLACILLVAFATPVADAETDTDALIKNKPPKVIKISDLPAEVQPLAGGDRSVTFGFMGKDANGWEDIAGAEVRLYDQDNATLLRYADITGVAGGDGASQWFNATFQMRYYEAPTYNTTYTLHIRVYDHTGAFSDAYHATFQYGEISAIKVETTSGAEGDEEIGFGASEPGEEGTPRAVSIINLGNVAMDIELYGTDLVSGDGHRIDVSHIKWALEPEMQNVSVLDETPTQVTSFDLPPGEESSRSVWWRLDVPSGDEQYVPAGQYAGSITVNGYAE